MTRFLLGIAALLTAGFAFEAVRQRLPAFGTRRAAGSQRLGQAKLVVVLALLAFPVVTILLAKVFDSNVLGWVFGLSLMFAIAMVPVAAIFYVGMRLGRRVSPSRGRSGPEAGAAVPPLTVLVERDDVHASDDAPSRHISVPPASTLRSLIERATAGSYLPTISGGKATWVVESCGTPLAVCAQQWMEPAFLLSADTLAAAHVGTAAPSLHFRYACQEDPAVVFAALMARDADA